MLEMEVPDRLYRTLGQFIKAARVQQHLTQEELAMQVGLTRTSINNIEHGRQRIQIHTLYMFAEALHTRPAALLPSLAPVASHAMVEQLDDVLEGTYEDGERDWIRAVLTDEDEEKKQGEASEEGEGDGE